ncbi:MAG: HEPN domain-containing protein [Candidatus Nanohaloarchaea archaeon]
MNQEIEDKLEFAEERLSTARLLLENDRLEDAVSRSYYAMFHAAKALLLEKGSAPKTHNGVASELGQLYRLELGKDMTREYSRIQEKREKADYGELVDISVEEAEGVLESAEKFLRRSKQILD